MVSATAVMHDPLWSLRVHEGHVSCLVRGGCGGHVKHLSSPWNYHTVPSMYDVNSRKLSRHCANSAGTVKDDANYFMASAV